MPESPTTPAASAPVRWTVHPAASERARSLLVLAAIVIAAALAAAVTGSDGLGLVAALALAWSLRAWFLPRTFVLDAQGASEDGPLARTRRLPWAAVRRAVREPHGLYLSTRLTVSRWLPDRGLFLRTADNAEEVDRAVRARCPEAFQRP